MPSPIVPSETLDRRILDYVLTVTNRARTWWDDRIAGTQVSRRDELLEYRLRMEARRSVAELYQDAKSEPFDGAANIGLGVESVFAEFLIPLFLANTHDLDPMLQAKLKGTNRVSEDLTTFHDAYHRFEVPEKRTLVEHSNRELLTTGGAFHKWTYGRFWEQAEVDFEVWADPRSLQPLLSLDPGTGRMLPLPADPKTPKDQWPVDPASGVPLRIGRLKAMQKSVIRESPELSVRPIETMGWPEAETRVDPNLWDWLSEDFTVSPYWLLGREGDPFLGKLKLKPLWTWLGVDPDTLYEDPIKLAATLKPVRLRAFHGKYPAAADGEPVEIVSLIAVDAKLNLGWRPSPFPRRPYFNRQVWHSGTSPIGKGIPETVYGLRSAMDALLNQDIDAGNLYNHPPLLLSTLAMLEDEDYETTGPGATWIMQDINGAKFLPPPISQRNPIQLLDWLIVNAMRLWGVSDLMLNSPTNRLSPQPDTFRGTALIMNQGSIKFGHLTKRLTAVDTQEYQYVHDAFRRMLANDRLVTVNGEPTMLPAAKREEYFSLKAQIVARGDGLSTNPLMRQQTLTQLLLAAQRSQNPFVIGDLEVYKELTEQWLASYSVQLDLKDPQVLQQTKVFQALMQTPQGQQVLPAAMQQIIQELQAASSATTGNRGNGVPLVSR